MYPMDRNENNACRQSLVFCLERLITHCPYPACIHTQDGKFPAFNSAFKDEFGVTLKLDKNWEELVGVDSFLRLRELELQMQFDQSFFHIEKNIYINGRQFDLMIEEFSNEGTKFFIWKFGKALIRSKGVLKTLPLHRDLLNFNRDIKKLDKNEYDFLCFYSGGASHRLMGYFLGRENGSSRNIGSQVLEKMNISNQDDAFVLLHLSELSESMNKNVKDIITRNVNRLL